MNKSENLVRKNRVNLKYFSRNIKKKENKESWSVYSRAGFINKKLKEYNIIKMYFNFLLCIRVRERTTNTNTQRFQ